MSEALLHAVFWLLLAGAAGGCAAPQSQQESSGQQPNLLFILTDEQRYDTLPVYGNEVVEAPHLDRLSQESVVFRRAYVSQPVCSPARSTLLTGLWPHQTGVTANNIPLKESFSSLPEMLGEVAYRSAFVGKWHLGNELSAQQGFDEWYAIEDGYTEGPQRSAYHRWLTAKGVEPEEPGGTFSRGFSNRLPLELSKPRFIRETAVDFLDRHADEPFILYLSYLQPHTPNFGPLDSLHDPADVVLAPTVNAPLADDDPLRYRLLAAGRQKLDEEQWRQELARYWGLVTQVDRSVGAVLEKLEELGVDENTIVVFTSEHGKQMGEHGLHYKQVMYEQSVRAPLMIRVPSMSHRIVEERVSHIDLVPTLLDLLGRSMPGHLPGRSLVPMMRGEAQDPGPVFIEWHPNSRRAALHSLSSVTEERFEEVLHDTMRTLLTQEGWKLTLSVHDRHQLFQLNSDPYEQTNLYYQPDHQETVSRLTSRLRQWQDRVEDPARTALRDAP